MNFPISLRGQTLGFYCLLFALLAPGPFLDSLSKNIMQYCAILCNIVQCNIGPPKLQYLPFLLQGPQTNNLMKTISTKNCCNCFQEFAACLPACYPSIHPPIHLSIYISIYPSIHPSIYLSIFKIFNHKPSVQHSDYFSFPH